MLYIYIMNNSKKLFKVLVSGSYGDYWFVTYVSDVSDFKSKFYFKLGFTEKLQGEPSKTNSTFIKGAKAIDCFDPYYKIPC